LVGANFVDMEQTKMNVNERKNGECCFEWRELLNHCSSQYFSKCWYGFPRVKIQAYHFHQLENTQAP
jgi:hypothetical protein